MGMRNCRGGCDIVVGSGADFQQLGSLQLVYEVVTGFHAFAADHGELGNAHRALGQQGRQADASGITPQEYVLRELKNGNIRFVAEDPDGEGNCPKVMTVWRSNLLGSSSKGNE